MDNGYKRTQDYFGDAAELYAERLFGMVHIDSGHSRPDLITADERFTPPLAMEVKSSGEDNKCLTNIGALKYGVFNVGDRGDVLFFERNEMIELVRGYDPNAHDDGVAVYFDALRRVDGLGSGDLTHPLTCIKFRYGDHFIVPASYVFASFVAGDKMRMPGISLGDAKQRALERLIEIEILGWDERRDGRNKRDLQNMPLQDVKYFLTGDANVLTKDGRTRVELIRRILPSIDDYIAKTIPGPNQTRIYAMVRRQDAHLFERLEENVAERRPIMESITQERESALPLLNMKTTTWQQGFNGLINCDLPSERVVVSLNDTYSPDQLALLNRLRQWLAPGESRARLTRHKTFRIIPDQEEALEPFDPFS